MNTPEYAIVEAGSGEELVAKVSMFIREGWIPLGGVAATVSTELDYWFVQALIRPAIEPFDWTPTPL